MTMPLIELRGVEKRYGQEAPVIRDVSLVIEAGETVAVIGPSGSGKSTLLNILGALDTPTAGQVRFKQEDLASYDDGRLAAFRNRQVGFVFQHHHLLPQLTAMENVLVPTLVADMERQTSAWKRAERLMERVGLGSKVNSRPGELSGGERQRVAVVRALVNAPPLLLADEPTGSLDAVTAGALVDLLVELNREEGVTLVMVTHAPALAGRMGRVLELCAGSLRNG